MEDFSHNVYVEWYYMYNLVKLLNCVILMCIMMYNSMLLRVN